MVKQLKESRQGTDWFELWFEDKKSLIETMYRNLAADLDAGYDFYGSSIQKQIREIDEYRAQFDAEMDSFKTMDDAKVQRWCYYDLKKRGAIS